MCLAACSRSAPVTTESSGTTGTTAATGGAVIVAAGTDFYGRLQTPISSKTSKSGDAFTIVQTDTFLHKSLALHGTMIIGHLDNVRAAGPMRKPEMTLVFDNIEMPNGPRLPVDVALVSMNAFEPKTHHLRTIGLMIAGAMAGHAVAKHTADHTVGSWALLQDTCCRRN
jgi:hypothetical protein